MRAMPLMRIILGMSWVIVVSGIFRTTVVAKPAPPPELYLRPSSVTMRRFYDAFEGTAYYGGVRHIEEIGSGHRDLYKRHETYTYISKFPEYPVGVMFPDRGGLYRVVPFRPNDEIKAERIDPNDLPAKMRQSAYYRSAWTLPLNATASFAARIRADIEGPSRRPCWYNIHIRLETSTTPESDKETTAQVIIWTNLAAGEHRKETVHVGEMFRASHLAFKVTNIVPPQDLPANGSFKGGHVVGWVEFLLIAVDEERGKAADGEKQKPYRGSAGLGESE